MNGERSNTPINDLSNGEKALKRNIAPSSSHMHTLVQGGQGQNINVSISLDPPYPLRAYLNHKKYCREDDVMHFIHDLSPHIKLSKYEALADEDIASQPIKDDMHDDREENLPTKDIPYSFTSPFVPSRYTYTTYFKEINYNTPYKLKYSFRSGYNLISKQCFRQQGLGKFEQ